MALNMELQQRQTEQEKLLAQRDDVSSQLQEVNRANSRLLEQVTELGQEKDKLQQELEETRKKADKRQAMLDELAIDVAQEKSRHKEELSDVRLQHEKEVLARRARYEKELRGLHEDKNRTEEEIRSQLRDEKARTRELESLQPTVEKLQAQIQSMEGTKDGSSADSKRRMRRAEKSALEHQEQVQKLQLEQTAQLQGKMAEMEAQQRATENAFREVLKVQAETVLDLQARLKGFVIFDVQKQVPRPDNVTVSCHNFQTVVYWNYSKPSLNTRFKVDVKSYGSGFLPDHNCLNTMNHHCNLSSLVLRDIEESYSLNVSAVEGSNESEIAKSREFTYNKYRDEQILCLLDFPSVNLTVSHSVLKLQFLHPFYHYRITALLPRGNKRAYKDFYYQVVTGKEGGSHDFICKATKEPCEQSILMPEEDTTHCLRLEGVMNNLKVIAAERICAKPQKIHEKMNVVYIVLCAVVPFAIIVVVAVFGVLVFKKQTNQDKSSLPKFLASFFTSQHSARPLLHPENEITSTVQSVASSPEESVANLLTNCGSSDDLTPGEGSRFCIGADVGQSLGGTFSGSGGSEQESRGNKVQGQDLCDIGSSGYDRPQILLEMSPGEQVEGYRPTQQP
ncbi:hypothetical protein AAFF_G00281510 [Aldrovandia affinis]|uniref:Fibronectin type-III domain-containing protein n=1 Tax=Aldrovandia affinis TaxID=143900 RepID=A0AAD7R9V1_9TELE|nr:hypothetical protein AAFF_G00281510 [Aldrovandia affinis]